MYIQLEECDYFAIAEKIAECEDKCGNTIYYSDLDIKIEFDKFVEVHQDTDYYNGTGEWITDDVDFELGKIVCEGIDIKYNEREIEKIIKDYLWNK